VVASVEEANATVSPGGCVSVVVGEGLQLLLPLAGLFDVDKELARLSKQKAKVEKELAGITGRLANPKFTEKASPEYIAEVRAQAADAEQRLSSVEAKLTQVSALKVAQG
jgi:valyl-tRNA synthetase